MSGRLQVLTAALLFSTAGVVIKATDLSHWQIACFRSIVAALFLLVAARPSLRPTPRTLGVALVIAVTFISFIVANKLTTAAHAVFLQAAAPLYLLLLGPWVLGEHATRRDVPFLAAVGSGVVLLFLATSDPSATAPRPGLGNIVAVASGVTWALVLVGMRYIARGGQSHVAMTATFYGNVLAALICLPLAWPVVDPRPIYAAVILHLGCLQLGLAYLLLTRGIGKLPALEVSLFLLLESALNPVWTWLVHGESPGLLGIAGGALILLATTLRATRARVPDSGLDPALEASGSIEPLPGTPSAPADGRRTAG
jgi:drug/metabolite transporter, DME family